jgi:hypothetical protein
MCFYLLPNNLTTEVIEVANIQKAREFLRKVALVAPQAPQKAAVKTPDGRILFYADKTFGGRLRYWKPVPHKAGGMDLEKLELKIIARLTALDDNEVDNLVIDVPPSENATAE